jgi:hypothetical protein
VRRQNGYGTSKNAAGQVKMDNDRSLDLSAQGLYGRITGRIQTSSTPSPAAGPNFA